MSSVLSASASLVDMDHSSDPDTPSKSFIRDSSSSSSSSASSSSLIKRQQGSPKQPTMNSPPRPGKPEPVSSPAQSSPNASVNGHAPESKEEHRQVPSQSPSPTAEASAAAKDHDEDPTHLKSETDKDADTGLLPGSDPDDDPDLGSGESDGDWSQDDMEADIRRVKVYELIGQKWTDRGTAFCQGDYDDDVRQARLIARAEHTNEILLQCIIRTSDVYQRQQDTLIVWTEPDGTDYALSFQDSEGCGEVWEFISEVQRHLQDKGVFRLRHAISGLAQLIGLLLPPAPSAEEEAGTTESVGSSMHTFPAGAMNTLSIGPLPMPALGNMHECERVIKQMNRQLHGKEKLFELFMSSLQDYVKQLIDVMKQAEDLEDIKELHACCSCMQTILLLNDHNLYEYILQDPVFLGVIGVLEYDPEFPAHKASYREFLETSGRFRQPIPIRDPKTRNKIHQTYRLQFLKDFILARATDDATFNVLNSCIIFNQIDIVNNIQQDERFLRELVGLFLTADKGGGGKDKETTTKNEKGRAKEEKGSSRGKERAKDEVDEQAKGDSGLPNSSTAPHSHEIGPVPAPIPDAPAREYTADDRRKDTIILIQQLCLMGKNVQLPVRLLLFRTLVDRGVLHAIQWALSRPEPSMITTAGEVLGLLMDHDVIGVRQHVMRQVGVAGKPTMGVCVGVAGQAGDAACPDGVRETLLETLCRSLTCSHELAYKSQMADALRAVLEVPQLDGTEPNNAANVRAITRAKDDPVTERFIEYFYAKCCENLFRPMSELPEHQKITEPILRLSRERSNLYLYLCDLLTSFILQHSFRSVFFLVSNSITPPLVPRISSLLRAREKHLRLAALRFFRACLKLGNRNLFLHLIKHDAIFPILELTAREAKWDNLLSSCCQEFFEQIRKENFKELLTHLMTKYEAKIQELARSPICGERFQNLIRRWEINTEPPPKESQTTQPVTPSVRKWGQGRLLEAEEEDYFNNSDDEETQKPNTWLPPLSPLGSVNILKRKRGKGFTAISAGPPPKHPRSTTVKPRLTQQAALVDYDEDDDIEGSGSGSGSSGASSSSSKINEQPAAGKTAVFSPLSPPRQIDWFAETQGLDDPPPLKSPHIATHRGGGSGSSSSHPADDPLPHRLTRTDSPPRLGEKRRRLDDDEDEMLERLIKSKKPSLGVSSEKEDLKSAIPKSAASGKMKLKLGASSFSMASASSGGMPPENEKKDVDGG